MRIIEITEEKRSDLAGMCSDILRTAGQMMNCIEDMRGGGNMDERRYYGDRYHDGMGMRDGGSYGNRGGYDPRWEQQPPMMYPQAGYMGDRGYRRY